MQGSRSTPYVLVVEDHPLVAESLVAIVRDFATSIEVCVVEALGPALKVIALRSAPLLILTDLSLTDMRGMEVVRSLRAAAHLSALLVVTANDDESLRREAAEAGAIGYIVKSTAIQLLRDRIGAVLSTYLPRNDPGADSSDRLQRILTRAQIAVLKELAAGRSNKEIAVRLSIRDETVGSHMKEILGRLGARNRTEAVVRYLDLVNPHNVSARG